MTLPLVLWTITCIGLGASVAAEPHKLGGKNELFSGMSVACLLWVAGMLVWLIVGRVLEVVG